VLGSTGLHRIGYVNCAGYDPSQVWELGPHSVQELGSRDCWHAFFGHDGREWFAVQQIARCLARRCGPDIEIGAETRLKDDSVSIVIVDVQYRRSSSHSSLHFKPPTQMGWRPQ
jgi:hypothetical protein